MLSVVMLNVILQNVVLLNVLIKTVVEYTSKVIGYNESSTQGD